MKSRILQKINQNLLLGIVAVSTLTFTSCSRSLTSLESTKKMQNEQVLANPSSKSADQIVAAPKIENNTLAAVNGSNSEDLTSLPYNKGITVPVTTKHALIASKLVSGKNQILHKVKNEVASINKLAKNNTAVASYNHSTNSMFEGSIRRAIICFVISLIFYLVGALFFWPVGYIFYILATIFLVVGIIYLLFWLLREM